MAPLMLTGLALAARLELAEVQARAETRSWSVLGAQARVEGAEGRQLQARAALLPQAEATAGFSSAGLLGAEPPPWTPALGLSGAWSLWSLQLLEGSRASGSDLEAARASAELSAAMARQAATSAWARAWGAQAELQRRQRMVEDMSQAAAALRQRVEAGLGPPADALRAQAELARLQAEATEAEGRARTSCALLLGLLREDLQQGCELVEAGLPLPRDGRGLHPALALSEALERGAERRVGAARGALWPTLGAQAALERELGEGAPEAAAWSAGLGAELPLGGGRLGALQAARAAEVEAGLSREARAVELQVALEAAQARWRSAEQGLEARGLAAEAARAARAEADQLHAAGLLSSPDWLELRRLDEEAGRLLILAEVERLLALAELEGARGVTSTGG
jgi:outer membrane protein TolC